MITTVSFSSVKSLSNSSNALWIGFFGLSCPGSHSLAHFKHVRNSFPLSSNKLMYTFLRKCSSANLLIMYVFPTCLAPVTSKVRPLSSFHWVSRHIPFFLNTFHPLLSASYLDKPHPTNCYIIHDQIPPALIPQPYIPEKSHKKVSTDRHPLQSVSLATFPNSFGVWIRNISVLPSSSRNPV